MLFDNLAWYVFVTVYIACSSFNFSRSRFTRNVTLAVATRKHDHADMFRNVETVYQQPAGHTVVVQNHNAIEIMPPRALPTARDIEISFHANSSSSWPENRSTAQGRVRARPTSKCGTTSRRAERCAMKTKVVACECCATPGLRRATQQKHISGVLVA